MDEQRFETVIRQLRRPGAGTPVDVVLDTDTYNEVDDQYAIAFAAASQDKLRIRAITAAPFFNHHSSSSRDGMERSYQEILHVLKLTGFSSLSPLVFRGAEDFLPDEKTPQNSPAAREIIRLAMEHTPEDPLYIVCIAAPANAASAILLQPEIVHRIVVVWSGGMGLHWTDCHCFNGGQNIAVSRVLLESGAPVLLAPGRGVSDRFLTTGPELEYWIRGKNAFCDYIIFPPSRSSCSSSRRLPRA